MELTPVDVDEEYPPDLVLSNNYELLKTGEWADAEITCKGKTWKVHKCIVCTRCKWFERAFKGTFKEARTSKVNLDEEDPVRLGGLLGYIYDGTVPHRYPLIPTGRGPSLVLVHLKQRVELWCLADFFLMPNLARYLEEDLMSSFSGYIEFLHCPKMKNDHHALRLVIEEFEPATCKAYENPNARVLQALLAIFAFLMQDYLPATLLQVLMVDYPEFQKDLDVLYEAPAPSPGTTWKKGKGAAKTALEYSSGNPKLWCRSYTQSDVFRAVDRMFRLLPRCHEDVVTEEGETEEDGIEEDDSDDSDSDLSDESI